MSEPQASPAADPETRKLHRQVATLKAQRDRLKEVVAEALPGVSLDNLAPADMVRRIIGQRDELKGKLETAPNELQAKLDELTGQIRTRDHRDAWKGAVGAELAEGASVEDLWGKLKYTPGESLPTAEQIKEQVTAAREASPFLFKPAGGDSASGQGAALPNPKAPLVDAVGSDRGPRDTSAAKTTYRRDDFKDLDWVRENQAKFNQDVKDGRANLVD